jgi:septum site-determining protein MinD
MLENELIKLKAICDEFNLKVGIVINKLKEARGDIKDVTDFIENIIGVPVLGVISFDAHVPLSSNYGTPVLAKFPRTQASRDILVLGENISRWIFGEKKRKKTTWERIHDSVTDIIYRIVHWN